MKKLVLSILVVVSMTACQKTANAPSSGIQQVEAVWSTTAQYGAYSTNGYNFNNDIWGSGASWSPWVNSSSSTRYGPASPIPAA